MSIGDVSEPQLERVLAREKAWDRPILAVLDTWGGAVSFDLVQRIAAKAQQRSNHHNAAAVLSRFASVTDITHGDKVFGDTEWRAVTHQPTEAKERRPRDLRSLGGDRHLRANPLGRNVPAYNQRYLTIR